MDDRTQAILDSTQKPNPTVTKIHEQWDDQPVHEQVQASRKLLYGVVGPHLLSGDPLPQDVIAEVEAMFESTFERIEQTTQARSGQRQRASTS